MNIPDIIIAIDGKSSTGKSSFARLIAKEFGFLYLDSGALYRCVTLFAIERGLIGGDGAIDLPGLEKALADLDIDFTGDGARIGGRLVEDEIRSLEVSSHVSPVSAIPFVRRFVDEKLHAFGAGRRVVMDGRDIGTTVFPDAEIKIFMTAEEKTRARRRFDEMAAAGGNPVFEEVLANLLERDYMDSHREVSPLTLAPDAFILDNSDMTINEELAWIRGLIQGKLDIKDAGLCR